MSMYSGDSMGLPDDVKFRRRLRVAVDFSGQQSITKQSFKDGCDMNKIVSSFFKTGSLSHVVSSPPQYIDVSQVGDFRQAQDTLLRGMNLFAGLPVEVQERFRGDASLFLEWASDPSNGRELRGLLGDPVKAEAVAEAAGGPGAAAPVGGAEGASSAPEVPGSGVGGAVSPNNKAAQGEPPSLPLPGMGEGKGRGRTVR